jgi:hypothetical protein
MTRRELLKDDTIRTYDLSTLETRQFAKAVASAKGPGPS